MRLGAWKTHSRVGELEGQEMSEIGNGTFRENCALTLNEIGSLNVCEKSGLCGYIAFCGLFG